MRRGDVAGSRRDGGTARGESPHLLPHCKGDSPVEQNVRPIHDHQSPLQEQTPLQLLSREAPWGIPRLRRHHLVEKVCTFEAPCPGFAGQGDVCPEFGETEAETADKVCLELCKKPRVKYGNNLPQLPPAPGSSCSCPQLLEELIPAGNYPGGRKHRAWGLPRPSITLHARGGCSRDLGLSLPGQARISGSHCHITAPEEACRGHGSAAR